MQTKSSITTSDADVITYHAAKTGQLPQLYLDRLTGRVVADISPDSQIAFLNDSSLQRFLSAKKAIWRAIGELRNKAVQHG